MVALFGRIASRILGRDADDAGSPEKVLDATIRCDKVHREYLHLQLRRTLSKKNAEVSKKSMYLIDRVGEKVDLSDLKVLCVGCRSRGEIDYFKRAGAREVAGIDLFSEDEEIVLMDMHYMTFEDDSFDVIFSCHSLEHARDYQRAVSELVRVARDGAVAAIEVPVNYEVRGSDLWDFKSVENLKSIFEPHIGQVLLQEYVVSTAEGNFAGSDVLRLIFTVEKR